MAIKTVAEVAKELDISYQTLHNWIRKEKLIQVEKINGKNFINDEQYEVVVKVKELLEKGKVFTQIREELFPGESSQNTQLQMVEKHATNVAIETIITNMAPALSEIGKRYEKIDDTLLKQADLLKQIQGQNDELKAKLDKKETEEKDEIVEELKRQLLEKDQTIKELKDQLQTKITEVGELQSEKEALKTEIETLKTKPTGFLSKLKKSFG